MEHLEQLALKHSQTIDVEPAMQPKSEPEPDAGKGPDRLARAIVKVHEIGFRFMDGDIAYTDELYQEAEKELAPMLEKHGLGSGVDNIPFEEEVAAGLFIGRLWRKTLDIIRANAEAKKAKQPKENQPHGQEREHPPTEQTQPVSGENGDGQKSDVPTSQWDQANG